MNAQSLLEEHEPPELLTAALLRDVRQTALRQGRSWLAVLEEQLGLSRQPLVELLAAATCYDPVDAVALMAMPPAFAYLPFAECVRRECVVVNVGEGDAAQLGFVFADPLLKEHQLWAGQNLPAPFRCLLAHRDDIAAYLSRQEESLRAIDSSLAGAETGSVVDDGVEVISLERIGEDESPVVKLVNSILYDALKLRASDIHLKCDASGMVIKYRLDGVLVQMGTASGRDTAEQVISRIKVLSDLDIAERRVPQDGRFKVRAKGAEIDFRVSIMPSIFGEDAVLRLLDRRSLTEGREALRLTDLGLDAASIGVFRRLAAHPYGLVLVTGPTGSGKTTTLYGAINEVNTGHDNIVTIEDPVEYQLPGVLQIPVNEKKGLTFAKGLRSILRHDPDRILVGEIRDAETAEIAVQSSLTGHLVFTTVHANSVFDVIGRFRHFGIDMFGFVSSLNGVVVQRLMRRLCPHCAAARAASRDEAAWLQSHGAVDVAEALPSPVGCDRCHRSGYHGRFVIAEVHCIDDAMRDLVLRQADVSELKRATFTGDMKPLLDRAIDSLRRGETSIEEIFRVVGQV